MRKLGGISVDPQASQLPCICFAHAVTIFLGQTVLTGISSMQGLSSLLPREGLCRSQEY